MCAYESVCCSVFFILFIFNGVLTSSSQYVLATGNTKLWRTSFTLACKYEDQLCYMGAWEKAVAPRTRKTSYFICLDVYCRRCKVVESRNMKVLVFTPLRCVSRLGSPSSVFCTLVPITGFDRYSGWQTWCSPECSPIHRLSGTHFVKN